MLISKLECAIGKSHRTWRSTWNYKLYTCALICTSCPSWSRLRLIIHDCKWCSKRQHVCDRCSHPLGKRCRRCRLFLIRTCGRPCAGWSWCSIGPFSGRQRKCCIRMPRYWQLRNTMVMDANVDVATMIDKRMNAASLMHRAWSRWWNHQVG